MIPSVNSIGNHSHISSSSSSDSGASIINSSLECNLNEQQQHHHPQGPESKKSIGKNSNSHAIANIVHHNQNHDHDNKSNITPKIEFKRAESSSSSSSEVSSLGDWHEKKRKDVVGDLITKMLNEGRVPHFGTCTNSKIYRETVMADGMKSFKWSPLLSSRNFRVIRGIVMGAIEWIKYQWNHRFQSSQPPFVLSYSRGRMKISATENEQSLTPPTTPPPSMWFILESFFMFYVVLLVLCDSILRSSSQLTFVTLLGSISKIFVDTEEVTYVILSLLNYLSNDFSRGLINGCLKVTYDIFAMMERKYLWGYHFQGRTILWSDVDRLNKFRKAHLHLMKVTKDRRQNRKDRRKTRMERRKKEKKGIPLDSDYLSKREAEVAAKETLNALAAEIRMKPPTYFPQQIHVNDNANRKGEDDPKLSSSVQSHATIRHLDSLQYCHRMVFRRRRERQQQQQEALKVVSISSRMGAGNLSSVTTSGLNNGLQQHCALSPKDAIEIEYEFPDIGSEKSINRGNYFCGDSTSTLAADSFAARDYDDNSDFDDFDDDSVVSYSSEATSKNRMDWLTVGAKIGQKILNSKEIQRVMNNPNNAKKLLPDEAKKLIDGMNRGEGQPDSPSNASSWEGQGAFKGGSNGEISDLKKSKSIDASVLKRPVHRMWSSPGAAARTPKSEGTPLVVNPSASIDSLEENLEFNGNRKTLVNSTEAVTGKLVAPTEESIELTREATPKYSGGRKTVSTSNEDATGNIVAPIERSLEPTMQSSSSLSAMKILRSPHRHALHLRSGRVVDEPYSPSIKDISPPSTTKSPYLRVEMTVSSSSITKNSIHRLAPFEKGVKIVVPMFPPNITLNSSSHMSDSCFYQMGTVLSSCRIYIPPNGIKSTPNIISNWAINSGIKQTNCLSIKVILDKALLRGSKFAEMNVRILDEWNYVPRHSKFPIGSCVATTFGIGVLVGWRVEDDFHIIRSLWNKSGPGTGVAYFQRDFIHSVVEAAVGFEVETRMGEGTVVSYVRGGKQNTNGKYFVQLKNNGRHKGRVLEFNRYQILSCRGATFIPVTEHIRAAALYQLEILYYKARVREQMMNCPTKAVRDKGMWRNFSEYVDLFAASFSKAIAEDPDFDQEVDKYISLLINMLDGKKDTKNGEDESSLSGDSGSVDTLDNDANKTKQSPSMDSNSTDSSIRWNIHDMLGFFFVEDKKHDAFNSENMRNLQSQTQAFEGVHDSAFVLVRVLLRTVAVARASVPNRPKLHMALAMIHESLLFIRQVLTVQRKNTSKKLIEAWFITLNEIEASFGPLKKRIAALGTQMTKKLRKHGEKAKKRTLKFVDIVLGDTILLHALELGDWRQAISRFEVAVVKAKITDADTCDQLRKGVVMVVSLANTVSIHIDETPSLTLAYPSFNETLFNPV